MLRLPRILITGSFTFDNYKLLTKKCDELLSHLKGKWEGVSGGHVSYTPHRPDVSYGAEYFARLYIELNATIYTEYKPNYGLYGNKALPLRNEQVGNYCAGHKAIIFSDGGDYSKTMIAMCDDCFITTTIINI